MIGGEGYLIRTDFRTAVRYEMAAIGGYLTEELFRSLWFPDRQPEDLEAAMDAVAWFYAMGKPGDGSDGPIPYGFARDAGPILAAFQAHYGVDLTEADMHWWRFRALLEGLLGHSFRQRVGYRTADLKGLDAARRAEILKYRSLYAIHQEESLEDHLRRLQSLSHINQEGK